MNAITRTTSVAVLVTQALARAAWMFVLAVLAVANVVMAADQHLTLRLEDGLPAGGYALPVTIVVPVTAGKGDAGAALAPFYEYGPHTIDGSGLQVAGDRITGTLGGKSRTGSALPAWTIDATIKDGRVTGTATAPAAGRVPAVKSRVAGYVDAPTGGAWMIECGLPWSDKGSHAKLAADGGNYRDGCFIVRLRLDPKAGKVVYAGSHDTNGRIIQAEKFQGSPESFTADITCLANDGKTPIEISLKGGRIGRGGIVEATIQSAAGAGKGWKGAATVWAWPDAPGFTGGREQDLEKWQHTAQPDPALVEAAVKEAATPIHPVEPGTGEVWQHHSMQRDVPRCTAPPTFDIRPLPVAAKYRLSVTRIVGKPMTLVDEEVTDPFAALAAAWNKRKLGKFRFQFSVDGKPATAMDVWLREPGNQPVPCPSWLTPVMQGDTYRVRVHKARDKAAPMEFTVKQPWAPLTDAWAKLAPGEYLLEIQGIGADGKELGPRPWSTGFEKVPTFQGPYFSGPARPYQDAALALARWTCDHPTLGSQRGHGITIPPGGGDNGDSQFHIGAIYAGLVRYRLAPDPNEREAGLLMAIETGDYMRAGCLSRGGMPKCYKGGIANTHLFGTAFLDLYAATGDARWKDAAEMVAKAYARLQLANGTWAELEDDGRSSVDLATAKPAVPQHQAIYDAGLVPGIHGPHLVEFDCSEVLWFLGRLRTELKTDAFRDCEDKAYRWVMDYSVKEFFWRDQGHHSPCLVPPFHYKGRTPSYFALYLLECAPAERRDLKLVAELMRFCETRHMNWSRPDPASVRWVMPNLVSVNEREVGSSIWLGSRFAMAWAQLGRLDGNRLHAEKARAIMDAFTHAQHPVTGNIGTSLEMAPRFNRFAVNAGRCAWNLMTYADLIAADNKTKGNP